MTDHQPISTDILKRIEVVHPAEMVGKRAAIFGSGGFARDIILTSGVKLTSGIEYNHNIKQAELNFPSLNWRLPNSIEGDVILGTGNGNYQYNQLAELTQVENNIGKIYLVDPYKHQRDLYLDNFKNTILILEHADGITRHHHHLKNFKRYFQSLGFSVRSVCPLMLYTNEDIKNSAHVFVWNGQRSQYRIAEAYFENTTFSYLEYGFFPQKEFYFVDKSGVNTQRSLMKDDFNWITDNHLLHLEDFKRHYLKGFNKIASEYTLVPLQVPDDANVVNLSRFKQGMQEFIDYIVDSYPENESILFKPHPKDPFRKHYDYRGKQHSDLPFMSLLEKAKSVHGINSSTLYEAKLAGVNIVCEGESLLKTRLNDSERLFAAMIHCQIPIDCRDVGYWLENFSHFSLESKNFNESCVKTGGL
ncbi:MAG: hypothetical protein ACFHVJ_20745 [Aestuariibacter sp.]